jgi:hypothetical protein
MRFFLAAMKMIAIAVMVFNRWIKEILTKYAGNAKPGGNL